VESEVIGDSVRVKVYYANKDGKIVPRYVKVKSVGVGKDAVVDDKLVGSDWVSSSYSKGLFKKPETIGGITLQVLGYLQMGDEIKFDLYLTNGGKLDRYIMPMQEAFCVVEIDGTFKKRYYSLVPETVTERKDVRAHAVLAEGPCYRGTQGREAQLDTLHPVRADRPVRDRIPIRDIEAVGRAWDKGAALAMRRAIYWKRDR